MNLTQLAEHGETRQVPATLAEAHLGRTSDPVMRALLVAARDGRVYRGGRVGEVPTGVLNAAARRNLLVLTAKTGSRKFDWSHGKLTRAGWIELLRHLTK